MPDLSSVEFWPATGLRGKPWVSEREVDAWVKSSRRVCELYGEALTSFSLPNRVTGLKLMPQRGAGRNIVVDAFATASYEGARVEVPRVVSKLTPLVRARLVLEAIDLALHELATARGWPLETVAAVTERVRESGLHFEWTGRTVAAPDHRRSARTRFRLPDDGLGRVRVEILDRASGEIVQTSAELDAYSTVEGFARTSKSLRWADRNTVTLTNFSDAFGLFEESAELALDRDFRPHPRLCPQLQPRQIVAPVPTPTVELSPPPQPSITGGSGGPTNDVPRAYLSAVSWLYGHIPADLTAWWAQTGLVELNVTYAYWGEKAGVRLRSDGDNLKATVRRPTPDPALDANPVTTAHRDLTDVLLAVQRRFRLPAPPPLPTPPQHKH